MVFRPKISETVRMREFGVVCTVDDRIIIIISSDFLANLEVVDCSEVSVEYYGVVHSITVNGLIFSEMNDVVVVTIDIVVVAVGVVVEVKNRLFE